MKRIFFSVLIAALALCFFGCAKDEPVTAAPDEIVLDILLQTNDTVYTAGIDYFIDGTFLGGQAMNHADNTALSNPKHCFFRLGPDAFPTGTVDLRGFGFLMKLSADPDPQADVQAIADSVGFTETNEIAPFGAAFGNVYRFTVTGSFENGFRLEKAE